MKRTAFVAAVALSLGGLAFVGCSKDETPKTAQNEENKSAGQKAGETVQKGVDGATDAANKASAAVNKEIAPSGAGDVTGIRATVEGVVQNVVKENEWDDMAGFFTEADRKRVMDGKPQTADHDKLAEQFTKAWNQKYGDKFTVMDNDKVFTPQFMALTVRSTDKTWADATVAASHGMPELKLAFASQNGKWKLDIPDTVTSQQLFDNLKAALTELNDTSKWPADKMEAYRHVSHRILMAVSNVSTGSAVGTLLDPSGATD